MIPGVDEWLDQVLTETEDGPLCPCSHPESWHRYGDDSKACIRACGCDRYRGAGDDANSGPAPGAGPDVQHRCLLEAAESVELAVDRADWDGPDEELAAKAMHLVACVAAVDAMCRQGDLPGEWRAGEIAAAREPRVIRWG